MKTLITGAPGWLGNRIVEILSDPSEELNKSFNNIDRDLRCLVLPGLHDAFLKAKNVEIVYGDLTEPATLSKAVEGIDTIIHGAGIIHPKRVKDFYKINVEGTRNILRAAIGAGVKRLIHISSNSASGVNVNHHLLMTEQHSNKPYKHYGISKKMAEDVVLDHISEGRIEGVILRPCWYYGPYGPQRLIKFFKMIEKGNPVIFGNGKNLRSMTYIDNLIQGILLAEANDRANGEIYWIADKKPYKTVDIYQTIADILKVERFKPRYLPAISSFCFEILDDVIQSLGLYQTEVHVAGEMRHTIACSIEKSEKELGFSPKIDLVEGMKRSIDWCRRNGYIEKRV